MRSLRLWIRRLLVALVLATATAPLALATSCTVTRVAPYDEATDHAATALQKRLDAFLTRLQSAAGTDAARFGDDDRQFYDDYAVELRALTLRAQSIPQNERSAQQLELMQRNLAELRRAHQAAPLGAPALEQFRALFAQGWRAILTLELAKRRGR